MSAWEITKKLMMCYFGAALVQGLFLIGVAEPSHNGVGGMALAFFFWALPIMSIVGDLPLHLLGRGTIGRELCPVSRSLRLSLPVSLPPRIS
jgi:hypothetical protein